MATKKVLITRAAGGMGRACARLFGMTHDLVLADVSADRLNAFADELEADAYTVSARIAGDTCDDAVLAQMAAALGGGAPFVLVHTAGLSPSMAGWEAIMRVNLHGTAKIMAALEPLVMPGTVAVLIASTAGHGLPTIPGFDDVLIDALGDDLVERCRPFIQGMMAQAGEAMAPGMSYSFSKLGVLKLGERKAMDWGPKGGRVVTISPGLMLTPMGRQELEKTNGAKQVLNAAPVGRPGTAQDIAVVAKFLASDEASFISGSDVRVDGGAVSALQISKTLQMG
jgi:NAD(P)-dependent dehydrogenase (short-subunit alcohol dehydrogenase family)